MSRRGYDDGYDCLDYEDHSNVHPHPVNIENQVVENPYYEGAGDLSIIDENIDDIIHHTASRENIIVIQNPYYE